MILCIVDGMNHKGFQIEKYQWMSRMAEEGGRGQVYTHRPGEPLDTAACVARLLGERPVCRRGYLEALGAGIPVAAGDTVFRGTWLALDGKGRVTGLSHGSPAFEAEGYWSLGGYRALLVLPGKHESRTPEPHNAVGELAERLLPREDEALARIVRSSMDGRHMLAPWGGAEVVKPKPLPYTGVIVTGTGVLLGLARAFGLRAVIPPDATGDVDTDLEAKAAAALELCGSYDVTVLHINGADEAGHRRNLREKESFIQKLDEIILKKIYQSGRQVLLCSDHGTEPETGAHSDGPQPLVTYGWGRQGELGPMEGGRLLKEAGQWQKRL